MKVYRPKISTPEVMISWIVMPVFVPSILYILQIPSFWLTLMMGLIAVLLIAGIAYSYLSPYGQAAIDESTLYLHPIFLPLLNASKPSRQFLSGQFRNTFYFGWTKIPISSIKEISRPPLFQGLMNQIASARMTNKAFGIRDQNDHEMVFSLRMLAEDQQKDFFREVISRNPNIKINDGLRNFTNF